MGVVKAQGFLGSSGLVGSSVLDAIVGVCRHDHLCLCPGVSVTRGWMVHRSRRGLRPHLGASEPKSLAPRARTEKISQT